MAVSCLLGSCSSDDGSPPPKAAPDGCQPLASELSCTLPYPSDFFRSSDPARRAVRVMLRGPAKLRTKAGGDADVVDAFPIDGASLQPTIVLALPAEVVGDGLPSPVDDPVASTRASSPTLLIDAVTGHIVPHYVDLDPRPTEATRRAILIRPFAPLAPETRYVVAVRRVMATAASGLAPASPPEGFRRLRDRSADRDPALQALVPRYESEVFPVLERFGVARSELQLAWDFTTGSRELPRRDMLRVRELTLGWLANHRPVVRLTVAPPGEPQTSGVWRWIRGTVEAPLYLDRREPGGRLARGPAGDVIQNGTTTFPFVALVPDSVRDQYGPGRALDYGHGFFGGAERELTGEPTSLLTNRLGAVAFGIDWWGMTADDLGTVADALVERPRDALRFVDRVHQAMTNWMVLDKAITTTMAELEPFHRPASGPGMQVDREGRSNAGALVYDASHVQFFGVSQSHILGGVLAALDPALDRIVLQSGGAAFTHLMPRALPFAPFQFLMSLAFRDSLETQTMIATLAAPLDRIDPASYAPLVLREPLPGSPPDRRVLLQVGLGDAAVPNVGAFLHARVLGLSATRPSARSVFGVDEADASTLSSALTLFDYGIDLAPTRDPVPLPDNPVHLAVRANPAALRQMDAFLRRESRVIAPCDGACDPE